MAFKARIVDGVCCNGLTPVTENEKREQHGKVVGAVPIDYLWANKDAQPIIADDSAFDKWVTKRTSFFDKMRKAGKPCFPWSIDKAIPTNWRRNNRVVWNQGSIPSCGSTATAHALQYYVINSIAYCDTIEYTAFNPIYLHYGATGGNIGVGISLFQAGKFINEKGAFSIEDVGEENRRSPSDFNQKLPKAQYFRSAVCYLKDNNPQKWIKIARAGLPIVFGSSQFYNRASKDSRGYAVGSGVTSGGHAECVAGYMFDGEDYLYIQNSHGDIYETDKTGKPKSGYWVTAKSCQLLSNGCETYGSPFVPIPHCLLQDDASFNYGLKI